MQASAYVYKNLPVSDLRSALCSLRQDLDENAIILADSRISLWIYRNQDAHFLQLLAKDIPSLAGDFHGSKTQKSFPNAADFLKFAGAWKRAGFIGELPAPAGVQSALEHLQSLAEVADARCELSVSGIRWRGDSEGWDGSITIRGTVKKRSNYLLMRTSRHPNVSTTDEAHAVWKQIRSSTGIDFAKRDVNFFDPDLAKRRDQDVDDAISGCFHEAVMDATEEFYWSKPDWQAIPGLMSTTDAINTRLLASMDSWGTGRKSIPFDRILLAALKRELPELCYCRPSSPVRHLSFQKPLTPSANLVYRVHKGGGLGKTFTLVFAVEFPHVDYPYKTHDVNIMELYRCTGVHPEWVYDTQTDLEEALSGLVQVIRATSPILENALARRLGTFPPDPVPCYNERPNLSARDALAVAEPIAHQWKSTAYLCALSGWGTHEEGRGGHWRLEFSDASEPGTTCRVEVGCAGRIPWGFVFGLSSKHMNPIPLTHWIDSPEVWAQALKIAREQIGPGEIAEGRIEESFARSEKPAELQWLLVYKRHDQQQRASIRMHASDLEFAQVDVK